MNPDYSTEAEKILSEKVNVHTGSMVKEIKGKDKVQGISRSSSEVIEVDVEI